MLEMSDREKFLFDLQGFLHIKGFLTAEEVKALNDAVDANSVPMEEYEWTGPSNYAGGMDGEYSTRTISGMFTWEQPWCQPFRDLIAHPKLIPYMNTLFGRGWRCEGGPGLITARKGCGGHGLHGFTSRQHDGSQHYTFANGQFRTGMSVIQYQLHDIEEGMGGVTVMPGSHKANFKCPEEIMLYNTDKEVARNIGCKAGDLVIFMEATIHGSLPWKADWERRSLLFRYSPKHLAFGPGIYETPMPDWYDELTEVQQAVLEPPYVYSRPLIEDDVETLVSPSNEPKDHIPRKRHEY